MFTEVLCFPDLEMTDSHLQEIDMAEVSSLACLQPLAHLAALYHSSQLHVILLEQIYSSFVPT